MPISRGQMPRQMYGLGSLVKSIGKTVKKIVKSPIGKAAILGFGANALMPGGLSSLFGSGGGLTGILSKGKSLLGGLSGAQKITGALALGGAFAGMEDQQVEELKRNPEALRSYLAQYYRNLNQGASDQEVNRFVEANMTEYKADGGRIGYDDGTNPKKDYLIKKGYGDMVENMSVIEIDELFNSVKGTTTAANTYREPAYMGGRMGYDDGTPDPTYTGNNMEDLPRGLQIDTTTSNPMPKEKSLKENLDFVKETKGGVSPSTTMYMFKMYLDEALEKGQITKEKYNKMLMPLFGKTSEGVTKDFERYEQKMAYGGRIKRAYGSDELVEQASGIEGLDININPKGVKELDLRETGGFIPPVGVKEKADDIPAMLSNNEFVFTADAVRAAGGGSVNKGAQIMYDTMKKLENGGTV